MSYGLRNSGIPLGGLGTGSVELRSDGYFHDWQIMNNRPWGSGPYAKLPLNTSHFGIYVDEGETFRAAVLGMPKEIDNSFIDPVGLPADIWLNDPYGFPWLEYPEAIECKARFPVTQLKYGLKGFPVDVTMEAFSPFIPHNAKDSSLPIAFFTFTVRNQSNTDIKISLFQALRNLTGYCESDSMSIMKFQESPNASWISFNRENIDPDASSFGSMSLGVITGTEGTTSYAFHPKGQRDVWEPLKETGCLESQDYSGYNGMLGNEGASHRALLRNGTPFGVLCRTVDIRANSMKQITFILSWHFPNLWEIPYKEKNRNASNIGHRYSVWFSNADEVFQYGAENIAFLETETKQFLTAYNSSTFPDWLLDTVYAQMTTLVKASWWDKSGRFGIWEGLGCCGLQTMDITHYGSFPLLQMFPELQESQMRLSKDNMESPGKIPHMMPGNFQCGDADHRNRIDLIPQFILLAWRDYLWTGNRKYAEEMWPAIKEAFDYFDTKDIDGDGLPNNNGPDQTYDQFPLKGTSAFVGFLFAAALAAAWQMAGYVGDEDYRSYLEQRREDAIRKLHEQLWNGSYYRLCFDPVHAESNEGVMSDQINGDWFYRQTTGEALIPDEYAKSALASILTYCSAQQGYLSNCAWPNGSSVQIGRHTANQADWPWSGVEYAVAAHLILLGMEQEGLKVARDVWDRYERTGLRFNHIECGNNYYRALSSWAVYLALTGFSINALEKTLRIRLAETAGTDSAYIIVSPTGWGIVKYTISDKRLLLQLCRGTMEFQTLRIQGLSTGQFHITHNGEKLEFDAIQAEQVTEIRFKKVVHLNRTSLAVKIL